MQDVCSSAISSTVWSNRWSLSPNYVQSDGSFYSATDSPTGQALVIHHGPTFGLPLGREGPFVATNPHPWIGNDIGDCAYWFTTYRESDFAYRDGQFGLPFHHPRFLEWVGASESARLLGRNPSEWIRSLFRGALDTMDQYVLCIQGMASTILELVVRRHDSPSTVMDSAAPMPCVCRASIHMEAMGLWSPTLGPYESTQNFAPTVLTTPGPPACKP